jgi:[ribosomal protein S5]-alanine N-acetyltransferase
MSESRPHFLMTDRLGFRCWSKADLPLANALWGDPEVTSMIGGPFTPEQIEDRLNKEIASMIASRVQYWPVFLLRTGEHAGCAGLRPYRIETQFYELGIHLRPPFWGRGLAQEAGRALITFAFKTLGANALFAGHHPRNAPSRRVIEKLGFRFTREEFFPPTGVKHPFYLLTKG